jgi:hypothetical protein
MFAYRSPNQARTNLFNLSMWTLGGNVNLVYNAIVIATGVE